MNNKDFINAIASKLAISEKEAQKMSGAFVAALADTLDEGSTFSVQGFGSFEVRKKLERVVVNPSTKQRMLVPPKLTLAFKPSNVLKDKVK